jgi:hypothetical protein
LNRETSAGYEPENTLLDLTTVVAVRHVFKGERSFGNSTGIKDYGDFARSRDVVYYKHNSYLSVVGSMICSSNVGLYADDGNERIGVAPIKKFLPFEIQNSNC